MIGVSVLGSTGSIGVQTLNVVRRYPDRFKVVALACGKNARLLAEQANEFKPEFVGIADESGYAQLKEELNYRCDVASGETVQATAASASGADVVVAAVVGLSGLSGVIAAINAGKRVALANKETLVACGEYVTRLAKAKGVEIFPVDSEHCAVFQCLKSGRKEDLKRIILTASGGPFRGKKSSELEFVTPEQAVRHPNWSMGRKISVDSATMMNKGLEIIEARWLFDTTNIDYIIHPESIIHSMAEFNDGSVSAQLAVPSMELPIQYALTYPEHVPTGLPSLDFSKPMTFFKPDEESFPAPSYAIAALKAGGTAPAELNAANEAAVELFLRRKIGFNDISRIARRTIENARAEAYSLYEQILEVHERTINDVFENYSRYAESK